MYTLLAVAFTIVVVQANIRAGRILPWPGLDDATYFREALRTLDTFYDRGFGGLLLSLSNHPPHSLFSVLLALASFLVLGTSTWAPYAGNVLVVALYLATIRYGLNGLTGLTRLPFAAYFLTVPFAANLVAECRPDFAAALWMALSVLIVSHAAERPLTAAESVLAGTLAGLAVLTKPSFFLYLAAVFLTALFGVWLAARRRPWRALAVFAFLCLFEFALKGTREIDYVLDNVIGKHSHIWREQLTWTDRATYHLTGDGGRFLLGPHLFLLVAVCLVVSFFPILRGFWNRRCAVLLAAILISYVIPSALPVRTPYSGVVFAALSIVVASYILGHALAVLPSRVAAGAGAVLLALGIFFFQPVSSAAYQRVWTSHGETLERLLAIAKREASERAVNFPGTQYHVILTTYGLLLNRDTVEFLCLQGKIRNVNFMDLHRSGDPEEYRKAFKQADLVIASDGGGLDSLPWLPANRIAAKTLEFASQSPGLVGGEWLTALDGTLYRAFRRESPLHNAIALSGLGLVEGPFAEFGYRKAMWAIDSSAVLEAQRRIDGPVKWTFDASSPVDAQVITVEQEGTTIATLHLRKAGVFEGFEFQAGGTKPIALRFLRRTPGANGDPRTFSVLFREIRAHSAAPPTEPARR